MSKDADIPEQVRKYVEEIASIKTSMEEPQRKIHDLRHAARAEGINVPALDFLVTCVIQSPSDQGAKVLTPVFQYAQILGVDLRGLPHFISKEPTSPPKASSRKATADTRRSVRKSKSSLFRVFAIELCTSLTVSFIIISLLL